MTDEGRPTIGGGRYELLGLIGRGGMADVNKAYDTRLGRTVAIKRLRLDLASDSVFQARFRREAQSAAALNHPSIVAVYDTGEEFSPDGSGMILPYIVMELVEGQTLRDILNDTRKILPERAMEITAAVLSALDYSHRAGIVHRDIKPANIMLTPGGDVKVMDFGIARAMADASSVMTQTAAVVGTAQYLSPEQARGEQVDARSDLYATGCVLYELLAGRPPFVGESPVSVAYQHVRETADAPSTHDANVPTAADAVTMKALEKRVEDRYQSAIEMRADLERAIAGLPVLAPAVGAMDADATQATARQEADPTPTRRVPAAAAASSDDDDDRRSRAPLWIALAALVAALVVAGVLVLPKLLGGGGGDAVAQVQTPDLRGTTVGVARARLQNAGLQLGQTQPQFSRTVAKGRIIRQVPGARSQVDEGTEVDLYVSAGRKMVTVPVVEQGDLTAAEAALDDRGLRIKPVQVDDSTEEKNQVTRTDPGPGTSVPIGSTVTVYYSAGLHDVPGVIGRRKADAVQIIKAACFGVERSYTFDSSTAGTVVDQTPSEGSREPCTTTVTITVSDGPKPTPTSDTSTIEPPTSSSPSSTPSSSSTSSSTTSSTTSDSTQSPSGGTPKTDVPSSDGSSFTTPPSLTEQDQSAAPETTGTGSADPQSTGRAYDRSTAPE